MALKTLEMYCFCQVGINNVRIWCQSCWDYFFVISFRVQHRPGKGKAGDSSYTCCRICQILCYIIFSFHLICEESCSLSQATVINWKDGEGSRRNWISEEGLTSLNVASKNHLYYMSSEFLVKEKGNPRNASKYHFDLVFEKGLYKKKKSVSSVEKGIARLSRMLLAWDRIPEKHYAARKKSCRKLKDLARFTGSLIKSKSLMEGNIKKPKQSPGI